MQEKQGQGLDVLLGGQVTQSSEKFFALKKLEIQ